MSGRHPHLLQRMQAAGKQALCVDAIVVSELAYGVAKSAPTFQARNKLQLQKFLGSVNLLEWPSAAMWTYGQIRNALRISGLPIGDLDMLIGAHALHAGLTVVTNNTREFERIEGLKLENWV
jgi:tRNA(fMet)-specific endonuclease VapC